jgi:hypothetical protein
MDTKPQRFRSSMEQPGNVNIQQDYIRACYLKAKIKRDPLAPSQQNTVFEGLAIEGGGDWKDNIKYHCWVQMREIIGVMTLNSVQSYGLVQKLTQQKEDAKILVQFRTTNYMPAEGA